MQLAIYLGVRVEISDDGGSVVLDALEERNANDIIGVALNPKLFATEDPGVEVIEQEMGKKLIVFVKSEEKINLIRNILRGDVGEKDLLPYGKWDIWEQGMAVWKEMHTLPVKFALHDRVLFVDKVSKSIYDAVTMRRYELPEMKVDSYGSLMLPVYYDRVKDVERWISLSLREITQAMYYEGLENFLERGEMMRSSRIDMLIASHMNISQFLMLKFDYMSLYFDSPKKFFKKLEDVMKEIMREETSQSDESVLVKGADYRSMLRNYIKRRLEE